MSTRFIRHGIFFLIVAAGLGSCLEPPDFSDTPKIRNGSVRSVEVFDDFSQSRKDSVIIEVEYQDGDGDLGVPVEQRQDTTKLYKDWGNYELKTFQYVQGQFQEIALPVNKRLFFGPLTKEGKTGPIEGTLRFSQSFFYDRTSRMTPIRFEVRIRDRKNNISEYTKTDTIRVPISF